MLDIGCNVGEYSELAARLGASVISVDKAPEAVRAVYRNSLASGLDIQPLLVDVVRPTPAIGWRNAEHPSFLDRAEGRFDVVLLLAVIHHIVINDRVPLPDLFRTLAKLTTATLIIEFVSREDPNFIIIARGRDHLFHAYTKDAFEAAASNMFKVEASVVLPGATRTVYLLRKSK